MIGELTDETAEAVGYITRTIGRHVNLENAAAKAFREQLKT